MGDYGKWASVKISYGMGIVENVILLLCVDDFGLLGFVSAAAGLEGLAHWCVLMG